MINYQKLAKINLEDIPAGCIISHDNGVQRSMVSLSPKGNKLITDSLTYQTIRLDKKRFAEMQKEGVWTLSDGFVSDFIGGSIGTHLMCVVRHNMPHSKLTRHLADLLALEARDGDKIVSVFSEDMAQIKKTGELSKNRGMTEFYRIDGKWVSRKLRPS